MGDELDPALQVKAELEAEEDPLAELARIVAGEPEPEPEPEVQLDPEVEVAADDAEPAADDVDLRLPEKPEEEVSIQSEMENALQEGLLDAAPEITENGDQSESAVEPDAFAEMESALGAVERELEAAMASEMDEADEADPVAELEQDLERELAPQAVEEPADLADQDELFADRDEPSTQEPSQPGEESGRSAEAQVSSDPEPFEDEAEFSEDEPDVTQDDAQSVNLSLDAIADELDPSEDIESSFQDDLISALQDEIGQSEADLAELEAEEQVSAEEQTSTDAASVPEVSEPEQSGEPETVENWIEDELRQSLDGFAKEDAVAESPASEPALDRGEENRAQSTETEPQFDERPSTTAFSSKDDFASSETPETSPDTQPVAEEPAEATLAHSLDEDLGAAFASEFEQLQTQNLETEVTASDDPPVSGFVQETPQAPEVSQPQADAQEEELPELDFGAAFAEELGVDTIAETDGWRPEDTQAASEDFARAVQTGIIEPEEMPVESLDTVADDPGHAGELAGAAMAGEQIAPTKESSGGSKKYAFMALAIALLAGSVVTVYGFLSGGTSTTTPTEIRVIAADTKPFKVEPKDPGGHVPANQDKASYERVEGTDTNEVEQESLISQVEEPAKITPEITSEPAPTDSNLPPKTDERLTTSNENEAGDTNSSGTVAPRVVQTVTVKPDGTIVTGAQAPAAPAIEAPAAAPKPVEVANNTAADANQNTSGAAPEGVVATPTPVETVTIKKPEPIDGAASTDKIAVPQASPLPKPAPAPKPVQVAATPQAEQPAAAPVRKSEWVVQVSSQRSPEAAQASFQNLRNRFSALQGRAMSIQKANVNGSTFYRVRVQTESRSDANTLCNSMKSAGGSCFVTR